MDNRCVCCGEVIPEGRQVCFRCETARNPAPDAFLADGTPLYFKIRNTPSPKNNLQLYLYDLLTGKENQ